MVQSPFHMGQVSELTPVARRRLLILSPKDSIFLDYAETGVVTTFFKIGCVDFHRLFPQALLAASSSAGFG